MVAGFLCISPTGYVWLHFHSYVWCFIEAGYGRVVSWAPDNTGFLSAWITLFCRASWPPGEWCMRDETTSFSHLLPGPYKAVKHVRTLFTTQSACQAQFHFDMTLHKSCRLLTLCSHPCLTHFILFQVRPSFLWSFTVGSTHQKSQMCHPFLPRLLVSFFFALDSMLPFCEDKSLWSGCTRDEMDWDVSGVHLWERQKSGTRRGLAGQWGGIQQV